jgi:acyl-CoA dehydrogenase
VRAAEQGAWPAALWQQIEDADLARALVQEKHGGAGLGWRDVLPMLAAIGRHAAPVPLGEAVAAHALAASAGVALPDGIVTLALLEGELASDGRARARAWSVPHARRATWLVGTLAARGRAGPPTLLALPIAAARIAPCERAEGDERCDLQWESATPALRAETLAGNSALEVGAALRTAQIAGAIARVLDLSVRYAGERAQFGKPIGKFQAIQQQLAQLGELAAASAMAAELACDATGPLVDATRVACAKVRSSEAAVAAASIGHAVHGAIGVTGEHDLQLYTRRLWTWRRDFGSEAYWAAAIGRRVIDAADGRTAWQHIMEASTLRA